MNYTKLLTLTIVSLFAIQLCTAQVLYSEDFQGLNGIMPPNMTLINADGLNPNPSVSYVNAAWIVRDELSAPNTDTCAMSTSWYSPAGTSNDWMITPLIRGLTVHSKLTWNGLSPDFNFPDGYEVYVISSIAGTVPVASDFTAADIVFSSVGENSTWTPHSVNLPTFAGDSVYVAFRNNSTDKFILQIDDIVVENLNPFSADLAVVNKNIEYSIIPENQLSTNNLIGYVYNQGLLAVPDVVVVSNIYASPNLTTPIQTLTSSPTSISSYIIDPVLLGNYTLPASTGIYVIESIVSSASFFDSNPFNDTLRQTIEVSQNFYARDDGVFTKSLGVSGMGGKSTLGNVFEIKTTTVLDSVLFETNGISATGASIGDSTQISIYATTAGVPTGAPIATSPYYIYSSIDSTPTVERTININGAAGVTLSPGKYFVGISEFPNTDNLGIHLTDYYYIPNSIFGQVNGGAWTPIEALGFPNPVIIRPRFNSCVAALTGTNNTTICATDSLVINGTVFNAASPNGTVVFNNVGLNGCDSTVTVALNVLPALTGTNSTTICAIDSLIINGTVFNAASPNGTVVFNNAGSNGCDSTVTVALNVLPALTGTNNTSICATDSLVINGTVFNAASPNGTVVFTNVGSNGCDSTVTVALNVLPALTGTNNTTICATDSVVINGTVFNAASPNGMVVFNNVGSNGCDSTVTVALNVLPALTGTNNTTICATDSVVINGTVFNAASPNGTVVFTNVGSNGCDSTVTVALNVLPAIDISVSNVTTTLTANQNGAGYQWLDCNNGDAIIPGAIMQSYTALSNGSYSVELTMGGCIDTSACNVVLNVGIETINTKQGLAIFPNPTKRTFTLQIQETNKYELLQIIDLTGHLVKEIQINSDKTLVDVSSLANGIYMIKYAGSFKKLVVTK